MWKEINVVSKKSSGEETGEVTERITLQRAS
jgi:hypothetical protein